MKQDISISLIKPPISNIPIVTFKRRVYLKWDAKERRLKVGSESLPVNMDLPNAEDKLKDRPNIRPKPEDVEFILPDYINLKDHKYIGEVPLEIRVKEIHGTIDWK